MGRGLGVRNKFRSKGEDLEKRRVPGSKNWRED
jgi:hypothetical protein